MGFFKSFAFFQKRKTTYMFSTRVFVWLVADVWCWFVLREKYCWLVADKPSEQADRCRVTVIHSLVSKRV
jgi:hypothetical protein